MMDTWFLYFLGILMALAGWLGGRDVKETEDLDRLMNSGLEEWEIVKLRIAMRKVDPYQTKRPHSKESFASETSELNLKELFNFRIRRK